MKEISTVPYYLYQYTTVDALKEIIKNKTIRFSRADRLNDSDEYTVKVLTNNGNKDFMMGISYYSSWTSKSDENVAMWYMYSDKLSGVRIKLRYDMFLDKGFILLENSRNKVWPVTQIKDINTKIVLNSSCTINKVYGPLKVIYEDTVEDLNRAVVKKSYFVKNSNETEQGNYIDLLEKSIRKTVYWEYENEYRFVLAPYSYINSSIEGFNQKISYDSSCKNYIDVPIFKNIEEVVIGPMMSKNKEKQITEYLISNGITQIIKSKINYISNVGKGDFND